MGEVGSTPPLLGVELQGLHPVTHPESHGEASVNVQKSDEMTLGSWTQNCSRELSLLTTLSMVLELRDQPF